MADMIRSDVSRLSHRRYGHGQSVGMILTQDLLRYHIGTAAIDFVCGSPYFKSVELPAMVSVTKMSACVRVASHDY